MNSEISIITNFGESYLTENCINHSKIKEWMKGLKKVRMDEEEDNIIQVIYSSKIIEDMEILLESSSKYEYPFVILGLCEEWKGYGDKLVGMRDFLRKMKRNDYEKNLKLSSEKFNQLKILFTDAFDVVLVDNLNILERIYESSFPSNSIVFMAEMACYPDKSLAEHYPKSSIENTKYLNSGVFFGPANKLLDILESDDRVSSQYDDQLFYTRAFLSNKFNIHLDYKKKMFASMFGAKTDETFKVIRKNGVYKFKSISTDTNNGAKYTTYPVVLHSHGPSLGNPKSIMRYVQNYFPNTKKIRPPYMNSTPLYLYQTTNKRILIALYLDDKITRPLTLFSIIQNLNYNKKNIVVFVSYMNVVSRRLLFDEWLADLRKSFFLVVKHEDTSYRSAKIKALQATLVYNCDFYFTTHDEINIENPNIIPLLIAENKSVVCPLIAKENDVLSTNFYPTYLIENNYKTHPLYVNIAKKLNTGIFSVPMCWGIFLVNSKFIPHLSKNYWIDGSDRTLKLVSPFIRDDTNMWTDLHFTAKSSIEGPVWVVNREKYGYNYSSRKDPNEIVLN